MSNKNKWFQISQKKVIVILSILIITLTTIVLANIKASASINVVEDGMKIDSDILYNIPRFPGYDYILRENWNVIIDGNVGGKMQLLVPPGEESSKGRTFAHGDTLWAWGAAMGGNPQYVKDTLMDVRATPIKRIDNGLSFKRYYSRDIAQESGAILTVKDNGNGSGFLDVKTTPFPTAYVSVPPKVKPGETFNVIIDAREFEPFKSDKIEWSIFVDSALKKSGVATSSSISSLKVPITISGEGSYTVKLVVKDAIERSTTSSKSITSSKTVTGPIEAPNNPLIPEPEPNDPPIARIDSATTVKAGDYLDVSGLNSTDVDGFITSYSWNTGNTSYSSLSDSHTGQVVYPEEGRQTIYLTVTDDDGASGSTAQSVNVLAPTPEAHLTFGDGSIQKVNRKVILDTKNTKSPAFYPVKWEEAIWEITPMDGQSSESIKINGSSTGGKTKELLFKNIGRYQAKITVINEAGLTDTAILDIDVQPDLPPVANFSLVNKTFRDANVVGEDKEILAKTTITNLSKSEDGDTIQKVVYKAIYDANNDGNYIETAIIIDSDAITKNQIVSYPTKNNKKVYVEMDDAFNLKFFAPDVGRWKFELEAKEDFGQPTIPAFIDDGDYLRNNTNLKLVQEKILLIDNQTPTVKWGP